MLAVLASQIQDAKLQLRLHLALAFFNLALLGEKLRQMTSVVSHGTVHSILSGYVIFTVFVSNQVCEYKRLYFFAGDPESAKAAFRAVTFVKPDRVPPA